ncbi:MAG: SatD family protein [Phenylobacterium sp.]|nr:SatD family protein [Phenylobacterium sp.]
MGDLVSSEDAASVVGLHGVFNSAIDAANRRASSAMASPLTITLGDEFQGLSASLRAGLDVLRDVQAHLLAEGVACRFVLGVARLETPINSARAWNMMGPGLAASRERLADKRDPNAYRFHLPGQPAVEILMEAVGAGLSEIEQDWTARQREVVLASAAESAAELAGRLNISLPTLYKIRRAGRFELYGRQWRALETMAAALDETYGLTP